MEMFIHLFSITNNCVISSPCIHIKECPNVPPVQVSDDPLHVLHLEGECRQAVSDLPDSLHLRGVDVAVLHTGDHSLKVHQGLGHHCLLNLLVHNEEPSTITHPLDLGQAVTNLLDDVHLLHHELLLDEVTEVEVLFLCSHSLQVLQGLGHRLLQLQYSSHGLHRSAPLHPGGLADVLQHHLAPTLSLVLHQGNPMVMYGTGRLLEEASKAWQRLVNPVEVVGNGNIDIAGIELHVDLLVDQSLALLMVVLADLMLGHLGGRGRWRTEEVDWAVGLAARQSPCTLRKYYF